MDSFDGIGLLQTIVPSKCLEIDVDFDDIMVPFRNPRNCVTGTENLGIPVACGSLSFETEEANCCDDEAEYNDASIIFYKMYGNMVSLIEHNVFSTPKMPGVQLLLNFERNQILPFFQGGFFTETVFFIVSNDKNFYVMYYLNEVKKNGWFLHPLMTSPPEEYAEDEHMESAKLQDRTLDYVLMKVSGKAGTQDSSINENNTLMTTLNESDLTDKSVRFNNDKLSKWSNENHEPNRSGNVDMSGCKLVYKIKDRKRKLIKNKLASNLLMFKVGCSSPISEFRLSSPLNDIKNGMKRYYRMTVRKNNDSFYFVDITIDKGKIEFKQLPFQFSKSLTNMSIVQNMTSSFMKHFSKASKQEAEGEVTVVMHEQCSYDKNHPLLIVMHSNGVLKFVQKGGLYNEFHFLVSKQFSINRSSVISKPFVDIASIDNKMIITVHLGSDFSSSTDVHAPLVLFQVFPGVKNNVLEIRQVGTVSIPTSFTTLLGAHIFKRSFLMLFGTNKKFQKSYMCVNLNFRSNEIDLNPSQWKDLTNVYNTYSNQNFKSFNMFLNTDRSRINDYYIYKVLNGGFCHSVVRRAILEELKCQKSSFPDIPVDEFFHTMKYSTTRRILTEFSELQEKYLLNLTNSLELSCDGCEDMSMNKEILVKSWEQLLTTIYTIQRDNIVINSMIAIHTFSHENMTFIVDSMDNITCLYKLDDVSLIKILSEVVCLSESPNDLIMYNQIPIIRTCVEDGNLSDFSVIAKNMNCLNSLIGCITRENDFKQNFNEFVGNDVPISPNMGDVLPDSAVAKGHESDIHDDEEATHEYTNSDAVLTGNENGLQVVDKKVRVISASYEKENVKIPKLQKVISDISQTRCCRYANDLAEIKRNLGKFISLLKNLIPFLIPKGSIGACMNRFIVDDGIKPSSSSIVDEFYKEKPDEKYIGHHDNSNNIPDIAEKSNMINTENMSSENKYSANHAKNGHDENKFCQFLNHSRDGSFFIDIICSNEIPMSKFSENLNTNLFILSSCNHIKLVVYCRFLACFYLTKICYDIFENDDSDLTNFSPDEIQVYYIIKPIINNLFLFYGHCFGMFVDGANEQTIYSNVNLLESTSMLIMCSDLYNKFCTRKTIDISEFVRETVFPALFWSTCGMKALENAKSSQSLFHYTKCMMVVHNLSNYDIWTSDNLIMNQSNGFDSSCLHLQILFYCGIAAFMLKMNSEALKNFKILVNTFILIIKKESNASLRKINLSLLDNILCAIRNSVSRDDSSQNNLYIQLIDVAFDQIGCYIATLDNGIERKNWILLHDKLILLKFETLVFLMDYDRAIKTLHLTTGNLDDIVKTAMIILFRILERTERIEALQIINFDRFLEQALNCFKVLTESVMDFNKFFNICDFLIRFVESKGVNYIKILAELYILSWCVSVNNCISNRWRVNDELLEKLRKIMKDCFYLLKGNSNILPILCNPGMNVIEKVVVEFNQVPKFMYYTNDVHLIHAKLEGCIALRSRCPVFVEKNFPFYRCEEFILKLCECDYFKYAFEISKGNDRLLQIVMSMISFRQIYYPDINIEKDFKNSCIMFTKCLDLDIQILCNVLRRYMEYGKQPPVWLEEIVKGRSVGKLIQTYLMEGNCLKAAFWCSQNLKEVVYECCKYSNSIKCFNSHMFLVEKTIRLTERMISSGRYKGLELNLMKEWLNELKTSVGEYNSLMKSLMKS